MRTSCWAPRWPPAATRRGGAGEGARAAAVVDVRRVGQASWRRSGAEGARADQERGRVAPRVPDRHARSPRASSAIRRSSRSSISIARRRLYQQENDREPRSQLKHALYLSPYLADAHLAARPHPPAERPRHRRDRRVQDRHVERRDRRGARRSRRSVPAGERPGGGAGRGAARPYPRPGVRWKRSACSTVSTRANVLKSQQLWPLNVQDDGFHEIQLNGKQLVFLFMAATVVSVVIFLCGVLVGRGVRAERVSADSAAVSAAPETTPQQPVDARTNAGGLRSDGRRTTARGGRSQLLQSAREAERARRAVEAGSGQSSDRLGAAAPPAETRATPPSPPRPGAERAPLATAAATGAACGGLLPSPAAQGSPCRSPR